MIDNLSPDVLVIGGGPAGSTIGTLLVREGYSVSLLEKDQHPRFHIGESLLPMNLPIFEKLGVAEQVKKIGLVKLGADFTPSDESNDYKTFRFDRALGESPGHSYEVKREDFDCMLFRNAQKEGVHTFENHQVKKINLDEKTGFHQVESIGEDGAEYIWNPRMVIDASGRSAFVSSTKKWKKKSKVHASAAIFGHFKSVERRPSVDAGNISVYWFEHGWMWLIPLNDDTVSIGAVCWPEYLKTRGKDTSDFFMDTLSKCKPLAERMSNAKLCSPVRIAGNFSYRSEKISGPGFMLIGDAYAFVDPLFSSGVYLAMSSAERAVPSISAWLEGDHAKYRRETRLYKKKVKRGINAFLWFIYRFTSPAMRTLMSNPRNDFKVEQAIISLLAGDVYENKDVRRRLWVFRLIYSLNWVFNYKNSLVSLRLRKQNASGDFGIPTDARHTK